MIMISWEGLPFLRKVGKKPGTNPEKKVEECASVIPKMGGEVKGRTSLFGTSSETETVQVVGIRLWKIGNVPIRRRHRA